MCQTATESHTLPGKVRALCRWKGKSNYGHFPDPSLRLQEEHTQAPDFSLKEGKKNFQIFRIFTPLGS